MQPTELVSRADLHIHSKYSNRPSEWFLRKIGAPESFVEPLALYEGCRQKGMDFVTISDHNTIDGALEIAHLPGTFISCEVTTYFPEDGCKIHFLVIGISEAQFRDIQQLRESIYDLRDYVLRAGIVHSVAHPLFRINDKLTVEHFEKLLLLFNRFEGLNGSRCHRACALGNAVMEGLTPGLLADLADRHGIEPVGEQPWVKLLTAGSDDHSGLYAANAYTVTPRADGVEAYIDHLRAGRHGIGGEGGTSLRLAHSFYHIAYSYYAQRFLGRTSQDSSLIGVMLRKMAGDSGVPASGGFRQFVRRPLTRVLHELKKRQLSETERLIVAEFEQLTAQQGQEAEKGVDERNFEVAGRISHRLAFLFLQRFIMEIKRGNLLEGLQSISSLGPVALGVAPYLTAFHTQHKDEVFLKAVARHFPGTCPPSDRPLRRLWVTDTFEETNGVTRTIRNIAALAHARGDDVTVLTCQRNAPAAAFPVHNLAPVGEMDLPEYEQLRLVFPPVLDVLAYIEKGGFDEIIVSTPGLLGLAARAAGRLFGVSVSGIYHTDFPAYIRHFTEDHAIEDATRKLMVWFYQDMDRVYVSAQAYRNQLMDWGIEPSRLKPFPHGVDDDLFHPSRREPSFWSQWGAHDGFKFLYVGRISKEKNLEVMFKAFEILQAERPDAVLCVVGDGPDYEELAQRYWSEHILFTGFLHGDLLARAYAGADVFVFPSESDTYGNVVLEAQASGLPAIVSRRGGPCEIVADGVTGIVVDAARPEPLAEAMRRLMDNDGLRASMAEQARQTACASSWAAAADSLLSPENQPVG